MKGGIKIYVEEVDRGLSRGNEGHEGFKPRAYGVTNARRLHHRGRPKAHQAYGGGQLQPPEDNLTRRSANQRPSWPRPSSHLASRPSPSLHSPSRLPP